MRYMHILGENDPIVKISAIVVSYNPSYPSLKSCITSIINQVDYVVIVDNSEVPWLKETILYDFPSIVVIENGENLGIAEALNIGCKQSIQLGCTYSLTLDQDSTCPIGIISHLYKSISSIKEKVGIIAPSYESYGRLTGACSTVAVDHVICSGSLMDLSVFSKIGGFLDCLFIDMVDVEYCWRLISNGYKVYQDGNITLKHHLGDSLQSKCLFGKNLIYASHSAIRTYYYTRNLLWTTRKYKHVLPDESKKFRKDLLKEIIKIIFISDCKKSKLLAVLKGIIDYRLNKMGKRS